METLNINFVIEKTNHMFFCFLITMHLIWEKPYYDMSGRISLMYD